MEVLEGVLEVCEVVLRLRLPHEAPHVRRLQLEDLVGVLSQTQRQSIPEPSSNKLHLRVKILSADELLHLRSL